jgi:subtilisin family serine protease
VDILNKEGRVEIAEPDIMNKYQTACVSDTGFARQWHLDNTNQYSNNFSLDINACPAWDTTRGDTNIIVAIFDGGISKNHPDLNPLHSFSYNCLTGLPTPPNSAAFPFSPAPPFNTSSHGTNVAGIIGARHNNQGYAGVAPNCRLMDIAYNFSAQGMLIDLRIANGFDTAWRRGAAVINCSWVENSGITNGVPSTMIEAAMRRALFNGRGQKGCIIVFAAGNFRYVGFENIVKYPASALPELIAVGGLDVNGEIANNSFGLTSHYGKELDIVVHGTEIPVLNYNPSTNTNNYNISLGTSLSAPMVAGVAALILSKNPTLTRKQVVDIIEQTATKLPAYTSNYVTTTGRLNGTWYEKSGYGLLNAHQAMISTPRDICVKLDVFNQILAGGLKKCNTINYKDSKVYSGNNLAEHTQSTVLGEGFQVSINSKFTIQVLK